MPEHIETAAFKRPGWWLRLPGKIAARLWGCAAALHAYWKYTRVPKENDLWVFTGFRGAVYMDNTKYFYEYVLKHHPEIRAVWLTRDEGVYNMLKSAGMPVERMESPAGIKLASRAGIAVTDHFYVSDYTGRWGVNDATRIVQLWHGVGFKKMGDASGVRNTTERGVRYSGDILISAKDGAFTRHIKKIKYRLLAPFREKMEKYFLFLCPGREQVEMMAVPWSIPEKALFTAGQPRNLPLYESAPQKSPAKILYAPTYRFDPASERALIEDFLANRQRIQQKMEALGAVMYLRLHPHTWRDYSGLITPALAGTDRVLALTEKDVYAFLGTFSVVISDYSSVSLDFAALDRPTVYFCPDYERFCREEAGLNGDFLASVPGPVTRNWGDTLAETEKYLADPAKDSTLRKEKCAYYFDPAVNNASAAESIVQELKKRLEPEV